ncbi:hypothetical protein IJT93_07050 [bacterium]|nr:hypothetical protein [bacterium]
MKQEPKLIYALNKNGELVHIDDKDVLNGKQCECTCPACGDSLIAKKGKERRYHFAHASNESCADGYETLLHLLAKKILSEAKNILLPAVYLELNNHRFKISEPKEIEIEHVEIEKRLSDGDNVIIPDVIITDKISEREIFVEIKVTHPVDSQKLTKIKRRNKSTIEIDLSRIETYYNDKAIELEQLFSIAEARKHFEEELKKNILGKSDYKYWVYNTYAEHYIQNAVRKVLKPGTSMYIPTLYAFSKLKYILPHLHECDIDTFQRIKDHPDNYNALESSYRKYLNFKKLMHPEQFILRDEMNIIIKKVEIFKDKFSNCHTIFITTADNNYFYLIICFIKLSKQALNEIEQSNYPTVIIDLSGMSEQQFDNDIFRSILLNKDSRKTSLFSKGEKTWTERIFNAAAGKISIRHDWGLGDVPPKVKFCPNPEKRFPTTKPDGSIRYDAEVFKHCASCPCCIYIIRSPIFPLRFHVLCLWSKKSKIENFNQFKSFYARNKYYKEKKWGTAYSTPYPEDFYYPDDPDEDELFTDFY